MTTSIELNYINKFNKKYYNSSTTSTQFFFVIININFFLVNRIWYTGMVEQIDRMISIISRSNKKNMLTTIEHHAVFVLLMI